MAQVMATMPITNWTAQLVLDYFNAHDITAWDHFTTAGQVRGVNPSNAMDLFRIPRLKNAQCNENDRIDSKGRRLGRAGRSGLLSAAWRNNAVMVAVSDSDPNVVAVRRKPDRVTPSAGITPGASHRPLSSDYGRRTPENAKIPGSTEIELSPTPNPVPR